MDINTFIEQSIIIHGGRYDYTNTDYINFTTKVEIICKEHGSFFQRPLDHLKKMNCKKCSVKSSNRKRTSKNWKSDFIKIHGDKYDYDKVDYKNSSTKIEIICKEHGSFFQLPHSHKSGTGCKKCGIKKTTIIKDYTKVIKDFIKIHGDKYDYSSVNYIDSRIKIEIICKKHGSFLQIPASHQSGSGCPNCKISKGEDKIMNILKEKSVDFISQHTFDDCRLKNKLPFDFYLPEMNVCIEYDGIQHFEIIDHFGGLERYNKQKMKDKIKDDFCYENDIKLLRISYIDFDNIEDILNNYF